MPLSLPPPRELFHTAETLAIATLGATLFVLLGFPAGLVSGSMLAVAVAALAGRPMKVPLVLARVCFVMVGILLGAVVTPDMLKGIADWPGSIALLVVCALVMFFATACYLRFVHGWDPLSALLGASPGSMAQVLALSAEFKADLRGIAIVHVMRVLLIVIGLPAGLALFGSTAAPQAVSHAAAPASLVGFAVLAAVSTVTAVLLQWLRFPAGLMFGALAGSGFLHGMGLVTAALPWWLGAGAVVTLGSLAGARFANTTPRMLLGYLGAAFGSFAVAATVAACFALIVVTLLPFRFANVAAAFAPGAQDTLMVLALALHLDPIYVGAHHLARFLTVTFTVAIAAPRMARDRAGARREPWRRRGQGAFED